MSFILREIIKPLRDEITDNYVNQLRKRENKIMKDLTEEEIIELAKAMGFEYSYKGPMNYKLMKININMEMI